MLFFAARVRTLHFFIWIFRIYGWLDIIVPWLIVCATCPHGRRCKYTHTISTMSCTYKCHPNSSAGGEASTLIEFCIDINRNENIKSSNWYRNILCFAANRTKLDDDRFLGRYQIHVELKLASRAFCFPSNCMCFAWQFDEIANYSAVNSRPPCRVHCT